MPCRRGASGSSSETTGSLLCESDVRPAVTFRIFMFSRVTNHRFDCMYSVCVIRGAVSVSHFNMMRVSSRLDSAGSGVGSWLASVYLNSYNRRIKSHRRVSRVHHSLVLGDPLYCSALIVNSELLWERLFLRDSLKAVYQAVISKKFLCSCAV